MKPKFFLTTGALPDIQSSDHYGRAFFLICQSLPDRVHVLHVMEIDMTHAHWTERICIENKKIKKRKTSSPRKLKYLEDDVFRNANFFSVFLIRSVQVEKCFFRKSWFCWLWIQKIIKTILNNGLESWNLACLKQDMSPYYNKNFTKFCRQEVRQFFFLNGSLSFFWFHLSWGNFDILSFLGNKSATVTVAKIFA